MKSRFFSGKNRTAVLAVLGVFFMTGLGFASVPLYTLFCQVTGLNGTTQRALAAPGAVGGEVKVDFDANVGKGLPWRFTPEQPNQKVVIGARNMAFYNATNRAAQPMTGTATFNVTPAQAGKYFTKIECFCFTEQMLQPGESMRMPVIYFVDPKILEDPDTRGIDTITLSYTFYPVDSSKASS